MLYEQLRRIVQAKTGRDKLPTWQHLLLGGASGASAALATMPLDFAKTVLQCGSSLPVHEVNSVLHLSPPLPIFISVLCRAQKSIFVYKYWTALLWLMCVCLLVFCNVCTLQIVFLLQVCSGMRDHHLITLAENMIVVLSCLPNHVTAVGGANM